MEERPWQEGQAVHSPRENGLESTITQSNDKVDSKTSLDGENSRDGSYSVQNPVNKHQGVFRTKFTSYHLQELKAVFDRTPYPNVLMRKNLAMRINLTEATIKVRDMFAACYALLGVELVAVAADL